MRSKPRRQIAPLVLLDQTAGAGLRSGRTAHASLAAALAARANTLRRVTPQPLSGFETHAGRDLARERGPLNAAGNR